MREFCTSGSVGAPAEQSLGRPDNSVSRATLKIEKNFVRSRAQPTALFSGTELRQEVFS